MSSPNLYKVNTAYIPTYKTPRVNYQAPPIYVQEVYKPVDNIDPKKVDVRLIKEAINYGEKNIKRTQNCKHSVIFWGFTGTGKSSTIIVLSGKKLHGYLYGDPILTTPNNLKEIGKVFI